MSSVTRSGGGVDRLRAKMSATSDTDISHAVADAARAAYRDQMTPKHGLDTGGMQSAAYVTSERGSDYAASVADAIGRNPHDTPLPEVARPPARHAIMADAEPYGAPVNYGHVTRGGSYWPGYHMAEQAIQDVIPLLPAIVRAVLDG